MNGAAAANQSNLGPDRLSPPPLPQPAQPLIGAYILMLNVFPSEEQNQVFSNDASPLFISSSSTSIIL